jgi:hypothetical protein
MRYLLNILVFMFFATAASAQYQIDITDGVLNFNGVITPQSVSDIIYNMTVADLSTVSLQSPGGDVNRAIYLNQYIRFNDISVILPENSRCVSACAIAAIGSNDITFGENSGLYFHTPYLVSVSTERTLLDIMDSHARYINDFNVFMYENGFNYYFWELILSVTNRDRYVVITSFDDLRFFKTDNYMAPLGPFSDRYLILDESQ